MNIHNRQQKQTINLDHCRYCTATEVGYRREQNEDRLLVVDGGQKGYDTRHYGMLFAVADGMGGHAGGEIASQMVCTSLKSYYRDESELGTGQIDERVLLHKLEKTFFAANCRLLDFGKQKPEFSGLGSTLSVLVLVNDSTLVAHVGDSRIYRLRAQKLEMLTQDHTVVASLHEAGAISPSKYGELPFRHVLTQALGAGLEDVYKRAEPWRTGDTFLICSDGMHDDVSDQKLREILSTYSIGQNVCRHLIDAALNKGGRDNITVIVVQV